MTVPREALEELDKHGIKYIIIDGELYYLEGQTLKVIKLCREGKLRHPYIC